MKLPRGRLVRRRVVSDLTTVLERVLDEELTGYVRLEPQDALLLDADGVGVLTFEDGVPVVAYHTSTDTAGPEALEHIAVTGPYRIELFELDATVLSEIHEATDLVVAPGLPAERLAGDSELAEQTRAHAPTERIDRAQSAPQTLTAVESFLDDEASVTELRERAREQATARADEWGFELDSHSDYCD